MSQKILVKAEKINDHGGAMMLFPNERKVFIKLANGELKAYIVDQSWVYNETEVKAIFYGYGENDTVNIALPDVMSMPIRAVPRASCREIPKEVA